tara:strand:- start:249 stop:962 length:714 start_codon:yes stop_codon:yes gene_type:complete
MQKPQRLLTWIIGFSVITLIALVCLQLFLQLEASNTPTKTALLNELIPANIPGWSSQDVPIAETEELRARVSSFLNFDDYLSRYYTQGENHIGVYIAYWSPGKVPPRLVGSHTPDTCWVQNGWTSTFRDYNIQKSINDTPLKPFEYGSFEKDETSENVFFWHLVGDQAYTYDQENLHNLFAIFKDIKTFGLNQKKEQYFIRISSNLPLNTLWKDPGFQDLMKHIANLGLYASSKASP